VISQGQLFLFKEGKHDINQLRVYRLASAATSPTAVFGVWPNGLLQALRVQLRSEAVMVMDVPIL
jgi:hypothetical protein